MLVRRVGVRRPLRPERDLLSATPVPGSTTHDAQRRRAAHRSQDQRRCGGGPTLLSGRAAGRPQQDDDGFTLVELLVTMAVISTVLLGLLGVQISALSTVTLSRERQQATDLANRTMEQLRALPYDTVAAGLLATDASPAVDANIKLVGGVLRYQPAHKPAIDEILVTRTASNCPSTTTVTAADCPPLPLYPHVQTGAAAKIGKVQFQLASYVTLVSTTPADTSQGYWLTVDVTWSSAQTGGRTTRVSTRSQAFSPSGCLSTATHPFSGPCQAYFEAAAGSTPAGIAVTGELPTGAALLGHELRQASVSLPTLSSVVQSEQIVSTQSTSTAPQTRYTLTGAETPSGGTAATTGATTDPATGASTAPADDDRTEPADSAVLAGTSGSFTLSRGASPVRAASTTRAVATAAGCRTTADLSVSSSQVCSSGSTELDGPVQASVTYGAPIPLASIAAAGSPSRAVAGRFTTAGGPLCAATSGVGCIAADSARTVGAARVGGAPAGATLPDGSPVPAGFAMVSVSGSTATATAESGLGAVAPAAGRTGSLTFSGASSPVDLATATPQTLPLQPVSFSYTGPSGVPVQVALSGSVTVGATVVPPASTGTCQPQACAVEVSSGAVLASVTYELTSGGSPVGRFTVTADLGAATARTSYRGAPSG